MVILSGLGKLDRQRISAILRGTKHTISSTEAAQILGISKQRASQLLARWAIKGWIARVKHGLYILVPLESETADIALEEPWVVAEKLYHPCYVGGWSAAEHWGLTEQIFRTIVVFTSLKLKEHSPLIRGANFLLHTTPHRSMFGLKTLWRGQVKVLVSDPSRTILDLLTNPLFGGGIRSVQDMLVNYLQSEFKNLVLLVTYAKRLNNGAIFKRLGFLLEQNAPLEKETIEICQQNLTKGKVKLDPQLKADKLVTR